MKWLIVVTCLLLAGFFGSLTAIGWEPGQRQVWPVRALLSLATICALVGLIASSMEI